MIGRGLLFRFKPLSIHDKAAFTIGLICDVAFIVFLIITNDTPKRSEVIVMYTAITQLAQLLLGYKALRNLYVYLTWLGLNVLNVIIYYLLRKHQGIITADQTLGLLLVNTVGLLLFFQLLRAGSIYFNHRELNVPGKGGRTDFWDNNKITGTDKLLGVIYFGIWMLLFYMAVRP